MVGLLRQNITQKGDLRIKTKPIAQIKDGNVVKFWPGPTKANITLGYTRNTIERCLYGIQKNVKGYEWRWITTDELCSNI
jgi:hypothetical protein